MPAACDPLTPQDMKTAQGGFLERSGKKSPWAVIGGGKGGTPPSKPQAC